jgi:hypothetical protein
VALKWHLQAQKLFTTYILLFNTKKSDLSILNICKIWFANVMTKIEIEQEKWRFNIVFDLKMIVFLKHSLKLIK